jgi:hypothetical protein
MTTGRINQVTAFGWWAVGSRARLTRAARSFKTIQDCSARGRRVPNGNGTGRRWRPDTSSPADGHGRSLPCKYSVFRAHHSSHRRICAPKRFGHGTIRKFDRLVNRGISVPSAIRLISTPRLAARTCRGKRMLARGLLACPCEGLCRRSNIVRGRNRRADERSSTLQTHALIRRMRVHCSPSLTDLPYIYSYNTFDLTWQISCNIIHELHISARGK